MQTLPIVYVQLAVTVALATIPSVIAAEDKSGENDPAILLGRWDLVVDSPDGPFPSWLEIRKSGYSTLVGSFVGQFGSARPIGKINADENGFQFAIPPQWEKRPDDLRFNFTLKQGKLAGETTDERGRRLTWVGTRAPSLKRTAQPNWGPSVDLFNGKNLNGWTTQLDDVPNGWVIRDGLLVNEKPGNNLVTIQKYDDFKLHAEFRYPKGSNSGIYLRGRYEVQIEDNHGSAAESHKIGGVYGFLTPSCNAAKAAGIWQTYDITLVGRSVTVILNGERIIDRQAIPGITGGALNSDEGSPGPILIQGDHGPIEFRKLTITPAV